MLERCRRSGQIHIAMLTAAEMGDTVRGTALLLGNGINRINSAFSWEELIKRLLEYTDATPYVSKAGKPFHLLYEQLVLQSQRRGGHSESEIKDQIARLGKQIRPHPVHRQIVRMGFRHILTTNYDYALDEAFPGGLRACRSTSRVNEKRYNLFRKRKNGNTTLWHINGEANKPESIVLGYEQYSGYLQHLRNYFFSGAKFSEIDFDSVIHKLKENRRSIDSWVDVFLTYDLYILGLSMDFAELCLWWLITYRARRSIS